MQTLGDTAVDEPVNRFRFDVSPFHSVESRSSQKSRTDFNAIDNASVVSLVSSSLSFCTYERSIREKKTTQHNTIECKGTFRLGK